MAGDPGRYGGEYDSYGLYLINEISGAGEGV
jgi:hypothetical protein